MVRIVLNGCKMPVWQKLALEVFQMCVVHNITIEPEWIPREYNKVADHISKTVDCDDWTSCFCLNGFSLRPSLGQ